MEERSNLKRTGWLTRNTLLLAASSLFSDISTEMLYPILPIFLTQTLHATGSIVGLIDGIAQSTQNIAQGYSGWLSDKLQRRKSIALTGYLLSAIAKPLIGLAGAWPAVLGARFLDRLGAGCRSAPRDALIASSVTKEHRGKAFGLEGAGDNLGAFLGPLITVLLLTTFQMKIRWIFLLALVPGLIAFLMVLPVKEKSTAREAREKFTVNPRSFPGAYWKFLLVTAVFGIGNSSNAFLILHTQDIGASLQATIFIYAGYNLVAALISYPAGFLADRLGRKFVLASAYLVYFVCYLGFGLSRNIGLIALLFVFYGLYQGIFRATGKALASDFVDNELRASAIGWYSATVGLLQLVASIIAGELWDHAGHQSVFIYGALFALLGTVALFIFVSSKPNT